MATQQVTTNCSYSLYVALHAKQGPKARQGLSGFTVLLQRDETNTGSGPGRDLESSGPQSRDVDVYPTVQQRNIWEVSVI